MYLAAQVNISSLTPSLQLSEVPIPATCQPYESSYAEQKIKNLSCASPELEGVFAEEQPALPGINASGHHALEDLEGCILVATFH